MDEIISQVWITFVRESSIESSCHKFDLRSEVFVSIGGGNVLSLKYLRVF